MTPPGSVACRPIDGRTDAERQARGSAHRTGPHLLRRVPAHPRQEHGLGGRRRRQRHVVPAGAEARARLEPDHDCLAPAGRVHKPRALHPGRVLEQVDGPLTAVEDEGAAWRAGGDVEVSRAAARPSVRGGGGRPDTGCRCRRDCGGGAGGRLRAAGPSRSAGGGRAARSMRGQGRGGGRRGRGVWRDGSGRGHGRGEWPGADAAVGLQAEVDRADAGCGVLHDGLAFGAVCEVDRRHQRAGAPPAARDGPSEGAEGVGRARLGTAEEEGDGIDGREIVGEEAVAGAVKAAGVGRSLVCDHQLVAGDAGQLCLLKAAYAFRTRM